MKSKGFTLIELLAVIVILAVIALIATPLIMGTITKAKKNASIDTANGIIKAGENYQAEQVMTTTGDVEDLVISDLTTDTKLQYKGSKPKSGQLKITSDGKTAIAIWSGQFCAVKNYDDKKVTVDDSVKTKEDCVIPVETTDTSCFVTAEAPGVLKEEEITIYKDKCIVFVGNVGYSPDEADKMCNNQVVDGITLKQVIIIEYQQYGMEKIKDLIDAGVISVTIPANSFAITGYHFENTNCSTDVVIPEKINGKTVQQIRDEAFITCGRSRRDSCPSPVTSLSLPSTIEIISTGAFYENGIYPEIDLSNLKHMTLLGDYSLYYANDTTPLKSIYLPNQYITYMSSSLREVFGITSSGTLKLKKGNINTDDIVTAYNNLYESKSKSQTRSCLAPLLIGNKMRETAEYVEYQLVNGSC